MRRYGSNNMENIVVRYAKREELESVNKIRKQVNEVHVKGRPDVFREDSWQVIEPFVYTRFEEENSGVVVALAGEVVVDENHRRKGIATALIDFAKKDAKEHGFARVELDMWEFNEGALAFYESVGFKTMRRYMEICGEEM